MLNVGYVNLLKVIKKTDFGLFMDGGLIETGDDAGKNKEILLPHRYVKDDMVVGESYEVFVGLDSEDRLFATTEYPYVMVGEIEMLEVVQTNSFGAFLDWGLPKDLFLPFSEQSSPVQVGDQVIVACYLDNSGRIAASMRLNRHISKKKAELEPNTEVSALVLELNDLGYKVVVNDTHFGILYKNEVFEKLQVGQYIKAFVKKCRPDGKIDLYPQQLGYKAAAGIEDKIMAELDEDGFIQVTDKTPPEEIYRRFGVSKKKFKMALGGLYKKRLIQIDEKGIRKVNK